ncbi:MAG TPA: threonine--tRNA ligase [Candidatus Paceibacterota bacterium]|nr:threonine--tRNA ligase [Candidatus Paceibacterota bacterium]
MASLEEKRHTLAHLLAAAVLERYPHAKATIGPAVDTGFYYDFDFSGGDAPKEADLESLEAAMEELLPSWETMTGIEVSEKDARDRFKGNPYKLELIDGIVAAGDPITLYTAGSFTDLCRGGHSDTPAHDLKPGSFKLERIAGAYWRGDEGNAMLTRIYGLAFDTKEDLEAYLAQIEEAKKRDHRKLGVELDLFTFSPLVGSGLPLYTPRGTVMREELARFSEELQKRAGFEKVWIPHITKTDLYKTSGHWDKFGDELFLVKSQESSDEFALKPMNCPHHTQIYASKPRSYRDLPLRYMETTTCYRDEKTGELSGLTRVRSLTQDDAHVFCRPDQIKEEFAQIMGMIKELYGALGMHFKARLSFSDPLKPEKYIGDPALWAEAERTIEEIAKSLELDYVVAPGEAAFYGPKIDVMVVDALGREWQCATQQLDFVQPERFLLEYTDSDGAKKRPVMIHKALLGTIDRFMGVYIEHTAGNFPAWLAPEQVRILPIGEAHADYARTIVAALKEKGVRVSVVSDDSLGKRIRGAKQDKVPYVLVIGDAEVAAQAVTVESRDHGKEEAVPLTQFVERIAAEIRERA